MPTGGRGGPLLGRSNSPGKLADIGSLSRPLAKAISGTQALVNDVVRETVRDIAQPNVDISDVVRETVRDVAQPKIDINAIIREAVRDIAQPKVTVTVIVRETVVDYQQGGKPPKNPKQHKAQFEGGAESEAFSEDADEQLWRERAVALVLLPRLTGRPPAPTWVQLENAAPDDDLLPPQVTRRFTHLTTIAALARAAWNWTTQGPKVTQAIHLGQRSWRWIGNSPKVNQVIRFARQSWLWSSAAPKVNQVIHLGVRSWQWVAHGLVVNARATITLGQRSWSWTARAPAVRFVLHLARQTWHWTAHGIAGNFPQFVALAQRALRWTGRALSVNSKIQLSLGRRSWSWTAGGIKASVKQSITLAGVPWRWIANRIGLLLPLKGDPIFTIAAPRQRRLVRFPPTYRTISAPVQRRIVQLGATGSGMTAGQDIFPALAPQEQITIPFDFAAGLPAGTTVVDCTSPGLGVFCTVTAGPDTTPGARLIGSPRIGIAPPPLGSNVANGAVLQRFGTCVAGTTYLLQCIALLNNGDTVTLEGHATCYQPT